nr:hypothetical protein [uncultured Sphingorhabdus sp.]
MKTTLKMKAIARIVALASVGVALSGCVYDVGLGYASDGYYDDAYGCDPYGGYDAYYNCDYGQGFSDIGFGGGWFGNYYYPGHGIFLFDTFGRRYPMRKQYRRYWGERRHDWYRERRARNGDGRRFEGRGRSYKHDARSERSPSPDRQGGRMRNPDNNKRDGWRNGMRNGDDQWRGGNGRGTGVTQISAIDARQEPGRRQGQDRGNAYGQPDRRGGGGSDGDTVPVPRLQGSQIQENTASVEQPAERSSDQQRSKAPRQREPEGRGERPD